MTFTKTTPGHACKLADKADATWGCPERHASWQEARDPYGNVVAYHDADGWFVRTDLKDEDVAGIIA